MRKICAWCKRELGEVQGTVHRQNAITHGMCETCAHQLSVGNSLSLEQFLDDLNVPVLVIEGGPRVKTANRLARMLLGKKLADIEGHRGGEVIDCTHARTVAGCGNLVHCKSCTIRNTVLSTFETGESVASVRAYPDIEIGHQSKTMCIEITTEKVGDLVMVRIDDLREAEGVEVGRSAKRVTPTWH